MRPAEILVLPTREAVPWHEAWRSFAGFFGTEISDYDVARARLADPGIVFAEKLAHPAVGDPEITYAAVLFQGRPLGLVVTFGRGGREHRSVVTDRDGYNAAKAFLLSFEPDTLTVCDADEEVELLDRVMGHALVRDGGPPRLARAAHVAEDGRLLFDEDAFRGHFERVVAPSLPPVERGRPVLTGPDAGRIAALLGEAVALSVPAGPRRTAAFAREAPPQRRPGSIVTIRNLPVALVGTDEGTYVLQVMAHHVLGPAMGAQIGLSRIGLPGLYDDLAESTAPQPSLS